MVLYTCQQCKKDYRNKYDYMRHCRRKIPCITRDDTRTNPQECGEAPHKPAECAENITLSDSVIKCDKCNRTFTRKDTLKRHKIKYCIPSSNLEHKIDDLYSQINELKEQNKQLVAYHNTHNNNSHNKTTNTNSNNTTNNNNIVINNNNIVLTEFSMEAYDRLSIDDKVAIINKGYLCIEECLKKIHLNDKLPEYKNVYIPDISSNIGYIVGEDGKWKQERVDNILYTSLGDMESHLDFYINDERVVSKCDRDGKLKSKEQLQKLQVYTNVIKATKENMKQLLVTHRDKIPVKLDDVLLTVK